MRPASPALEISDGQRETLTVLSRSRSAPVREVQRAKALLLAADGAANYRIGAEVGVGPATVAAWRDRFAAEGLVSSGRYGRVVARSRRSRNPRSTRSLN